VIADPFEERETAGTLAMATTNPPRAADMAAMAAGKTPPPPDKGISAISANCTACCSAAWKSTGICSGAELREHDSAGMMGDGGQGGEGKR
jgi:hypothetical protein